VRLTILGCAGTFPGPGQPCSGYLLESGGYRILLDAGNGSTGTLQAQCGLLDLDAIVISHLHGDHFLDLVTYTYARRYHPDGPRPPVPTYGPAGLAGALQGTFGRPAGEALADVYAFRELAAGPLSLGPFEFRLARMNHPVETYGMRIGDGRSSLAYSADTGECPALVELAHDVDAFLCEASYLEGQDNPPDVHLTGRQAGEHATRAGAHRLLLTHLVPWGDCARSLAEARTTYAGPADVVRTGSSLEM
jgi:ribonuclease BN (tRNA processing enzyme)